MGLQFKGKGFIQLLWGLPFLALPIAPESFALAALPLSFYLWFIRREKPIWPGLFVTQAAIWSVAHLLSTTPSESSRPSWLNQSPSRTTINTIPAHGWADLHGWNSQDAAGPPAVRGSDGFWRITRVHPVSRQPFVEILSENFYPVQANQIYTLSLYLRHDGTQIGFDVSFFIKDSHQPVPAQIVPLGNGLYRAYASYRPAESQHIRTPDLINLSGDWSYVEIGYVQLEPSSTVSSYTPYTPSVQERLQGLSWTIGTPLLGLTSLQAGRFLLHQVSASIASRFLLAGLTIHAAYATYQYFTALQTLKSRVSGYSPNPNLLGHTGIMAGLLVVMLGGLRPGMWAVLLSGLLVFLCGSRTALLGWLGLIVTASTGYYRRISLGFVVLLVFIAFLLLLSQKPRLLDLFASLADQTRWTIWQTLWTAIVSYPWFGIGTGNVPAYFLLYRPNEVLEINIPHAHNVYLQLLTELGLIGLIGFALVWTWAIYVLAQRRAWGVVLAIACIAFMNLFDYSWYYAGVHYGLWIVVAWGAFIQPDKITQ